VLNQQTIKTNKILSIKTVIRSQSETTTTFSLILIIRSFVSVIANHLQSKASDSHIHTQPKFPQAQKTHLARFRTKGSSKVVGCHSRKLTNSLEHSQLSYKQSPLVTTIYQLLRMTVYKSVYTRSTADMLTRLQVLLTLSHKYFARFNRSTCALSVSCHYYDLRRIHLVYSL